MKIKFIKEIPDAFTSIPFFTYVFDESHTKHPGYIDLKKIIIENHIAWLDHVQASHTVLSKRFCQFSRWWWVTPMSRLDARPWGQEYILKPLFFARAVIKWIECHSEVGEIALVGCDHAVARYVREFDKELVIENNEKVPPVIIMVGTCLKESLVAFIKLGKQFFVLCRDHVFSRANFPKTQVLVLYDLNAGDNISSGHRYIYGDIFDTFEKDYLISFACVSGSKVRNHIENGKDGLRAFYLLDFVGPLDALVCLGINIVIISLSWIFVFARQACQIDGRVSHSFWVNYLFHELARIPCLTGICSHKALKKILSDHNCKIVVYPYEEKGSERAILFACEGKNVKTIGYAPHPQHRLTLALRDGQMPLSPKPMLYAVCGDAYIEYFRGWGKKKDHPISVWGSGKSFERVQYFRKMQHPQVKVLLFISHPNELKVFSSWLRSIEQISKGVIYSLRTYKALRCKELENMLKSLSRDFECVRESCNNLIDELLWCDIAAFCATSAGLVAVKQGCLAVHLALDEFFPINPCFDRLDDMLSCASADQFADLILKFRQLDENTWKQIYDRQQFFAERVFSPAQRDTIENDVFGGFCSIEKNLMSEVQK